MTINREHRNKHKERDKRAMRKYEKFGGERYFLFSLFFRKGKIKAKRD
jgi:hypothetical protein